MQGVLDLIGSAGDSGNSTLFGRLSNASIIKSIQRGRIPDGSPCVSNNNMEKPEYKFQSSNSEYTIYIDIPISTVDISRCIVKAHGFSKYECFTEFVNANTLRIFSYASNYSYSTLQGAIEWQIIEFK